MVCIFTGVFQTTLTTLVASDRTSALWTEHRGLIPAFTGRPISLLYLCLPLIPLGASLEERDVCLLHVGMPGQEGCYTEIVSL